jgi:hypothetical protein
VRDRLTTSDRTGEPAAPQAAPIAHGLLGRSMRRDSRARRMVLAAFVYVVCASVYAVVAGRERLTEHTAFNHYALLAEAWLHGRQDLGGPPPAYTQNNDFAEYKGKTYISFPPLPALLMLPFVRLAGSAENFRDGQFVIWLSGMAPAFLFLALEKLRRTGRSSRLESENLVLAFLFAFGTVYFFTAVEGTVWFAAMVVAAAAMALFVLFALDAERPILAGMMVGCIWLSRPPALLLSLLFALEAMRVSTDGGFPREGSWTKRLRATLARLNVRALAQRYALFSIPILGSFAVVAWMNWTRYGRATPLYFDHTFLTVGWRARILRWGLFGYHYLPKNLGIVLTSLPWLPTPGDPAALGAPFKINEHGLALWFTTPLYLWVLWPKGLSSDPERKWLYCSVAISAALPAVMGLLYQNSGWRQFGYRMSNDYAVFLFVLLALGARPMKWLFRTAATWGVAWNLFGAITFDKARFDRFYYRDGSQTIVYQPD